MVKKIVHIADLHIRTYQLHDLYKKQFEILIENLKGHLKDYDYSEIRIVIAGDVAHQKINISNEQILLTSWLFTELTKIGKLIIIPGNHDFLENNTERLDSITPIVELLENSNISYFKDSGKYTDENIDWVVYSLYNHNIKPEYVKDYNQFTVGLFHGPIQGLTTDLGYMFEHAYDPINFIDLDLLLCGDIHKNQNFKLPNGGKAIMVGSLIQQNFGEKIRHHGYGIYDILEDKYSFYELPNEQPFLHFKITDILDIEEEKEELINF